MRDRPPLYSAILRALAETPAANLPRRIHKRHNAAVTLKGCAATRHPSERR